MRSRQYRSFTVQAPGAVQAVPAAPVSNRNGGKYLALFGQVLALNKTNALPVRFAEPSHGKAVFAALRVLAKKKGVSLQSSRTEDGLTFYFWLEERA